MAKRRAVVYSEGAQRNGNGVWASPHADCGECVPTRRIGTVHRRWINRYVAGITNIDSKGAVIMPPTIGAAIRRMSSELVPLPHMIGSSPAMITDTIIATGRTRSAAPSTIPWTSSLRSWSAPTAIRAVIA